MCQRIAMKESVSTAVRKSESLPCSLKAAKWLNKLGQHNYRTKTGIRQFAMKWSSVHVENFSMRKAN